MKEITEPEMLHRAAAYCSAAERCIQDVQKRSMPPDFPDASGAYHRPLAERAVYRRIPLHPFLRER